MTTISITKYQWLKNPLVKSLLLQRIFFSSTSKSTETPLACWNCTVPTDCGAYFCQSCGTLQPIFQEDGSLNYFSIFGLKSSFELNTGELGVTFKNLQKLFHPDKYGRRSETEKKYSEQCSSVVNEAYTTLSDPLRRAQHLLSLKGHKISDKTSGSELDKSFLLEIMELNEELETTKESRQLEEIEDRVVLFFDNLIAEISNCFMTNEYDKARLILLKLRYLANLKQQISELKLTLGGW